MRTCSAPHNAPPVLSPLELGVREADEDLRQLSSSKEAREILHCVDSLHRQALSLHPSTSAGDTWSSWESRRMRDENQRTPATPCFRSARMRNLTNSATFILISRPRMRSWRVISLNPKSNPPKPHPMSNISTGASRRTSSGSSPNTASQLNSSGAGGLRWMERNRMRTAV